MSELLDAFTRLLAYLGDEEAANGYINEIDFERRPNELTPDQIKALLPTFLSAIQGNAAALNSLQPDISDKVSGIVDLSQDRFPDQKDELIQYIQESIDGIPNNQNNNNSNTQTLSNNDENGLRVNGGAKKRRSTRRKVTRRRSTRHKKTRNVKRKYERRN